MKTFIRQHARTLFYATWFVLGLIQALFTELQDDEAYYWVFAHFLDWGYFDHPPMVALLIKAGGLLFGGELGVRIFPLLLNTATLLITESLLNKKDRILFYAICLSVAVIQITGFWAVPDVPLLFFTALFFWCYRNFLKNVSLASTLMLAVACALLLYTKYHGVLIIFFTLLSNLQLLKRWHIYAAGILALLLFIPHLYWQYGHDWISFRYHLFESNVNPYKLSYTTDYILGQVLIAGPLAGFILLWATFTYHTKDKVEKALQYTGVGIFIFFFISTFKGKVEANWTAPAIIPMLVLTHQFLLQKEAWKKWLYRLLPITMVLVLLVRVIMIADVIPAKAIVQRFHAWKDWPAEVTKITKGTPIVFNNSYQRASKIWFYTGTPAYSLNSYTERRSNYNFWPLEDSLLGKPVYVMDIYNTSAYQDSIQARLWNVGYSFDSSFHSFARLRFQPEQKEHRIQQGAPLVLTLKITVPQLFKNYLLQHPEVNRPIKIGVFQKREWVKDLPLSITLQDIVNKEKIQVQADPQLPKGDYFIRIAIGTNTGLYTHNSDKINITVE